MRLLEIRKSLESDYYYMDRPNQPFMPIMTQAHEHRLEKVLNMNLSNGIQTDTKGLMKELNRALFRIRYRRMFTVLSLSFAFISDAADRIRSWANAKAKGFSV